MRERVEICEIENRHCHIYRSGGSVPYIYWGTQKDAADSFDAMLRFLNQELGEDAYNLVVFEGEDWNSDFSPWPAPAVYGKDSEGFAGNGENTYQWLITRCIPYAESTNYCQVRLLAGYSLAGLFALWAFYHDDYFQAVVSGSGSLWYPNWISFAKSVRAPKNSVAYLSLGTKEEKTKNPAMASVGEATRETELLLKQDENIAAATLEWNPGGHFQKPQKRMEKGILWAMKELAKVQM